MLYCTSVLIYRKYCYLISCRLLKTLIISVQQRSAFISNSCWNAKDALSRLKDRLEEDCACFELLLNRAAVGWAVSCSAFGLFIYLFFLVLSVSRPKLPLGLLSSPDDVIISQLQAISQLFSSNPPQEPFVKLAN